MNTIALAIDGKKISCSSETTIFEAAKAEGIYIPNLCYHPELKPYGACRMCLVEDEATGRLMASCVTPVADQMSVLTNTPRIVEHRRNIVRMMMAEHPESCIVCNMGNRCLLRKTAAELGVGETDLYPMPNYARLDQSNPFIVRDLSKCILCAKCIRACKELVVEGVIDYCNRGFKARPSTIHDVSLADSTCTFCGTCVSICPTGALTQRHKYFTGTPGHTHTTVCGYCGIGCRLSMGTFGNQVVEATPAKDINSVNGATLCVRGHMAHDFLNSRQRLTKPSIRKNDEPGVVDWDEALRYVSEKLLAIKEKYGPRSIGFFGSSKCTNEENYLFQKIARAAIGTNNIDNGGILYGRAMMHLFDCTTRGACRINKLADIEASEAIITLGADPGNTTPVLGYYIKRAAEKGIPVIEICSGPSTLSRVSSIKLKSVTPDGNAELLKTLSATICQKHIYDLPFMEKHIDNFEEVLDQLTTIDIDASAKNIGIDKEAIEKTVNTIRGKRISFVVGNRILESKGGDTVIEALINLVLLTGVIGKQNCGIYFTTKENNLTGAWDMGSVPDALPGRFSLGNESLRKRLELAWQVELSETPGLDITGMIEAAENDQLKALYIMGENPLRNLPQPDRVRQAFEKLDLVIVQDILKTETAQLADVILPGAAFSEKNGSFTNMEGRIQSFTSVTAPPDKAKSDLEILGRLFQMITHRDVSCEMQDIRKEISTLVPLYTDLAECKQEAWLSSNGKDLEASLSITVAFSETTIDALPDDNFPFYADITSLHFHAGGGTRTSHSDRICTSGVQGEIEMSCNDSKKFGLKNGDLIRVDSPYGNITRNVIIKHGLQDGTVYIPMAFNSNDAMKLLPLITPISKRCFVRIEKY